MSTMEDYKRHREDVLRIVEVFMQHGITLDPLRAYMAWDSYSSDYEASWLFLPDDDDELFNTVLGKLRHLEAE